MIDTGSYATAPRGCDAHAVAYAREMIEKGYGFQNAARISGVPTETLRGLLTVKPRTEVVVPPRPRWLPQNLEAPLPVEPHRPTSASDETRAVIMEVAQRHGLTFNQIMSPRRIRALAWPRQEAMYEVRIRRQLSWHTIARVFGGLDHSTVIHGYQVHQARMLWADILINAANGPYQPDLFAVAA